jgi:hypothetical protein
MYCLIWANIYKDICKRSGKALAGLKKSTGGASLEA